MPLAACSSRLPLVNVPSVAVCQGFSSCDTCGKSAPFRGRATFAPLSAPLPHGLRLLPHLLPAPPSPFLTVRLLAGCTRCTTPRVVQAYHVPRVSPIGFGRLCVHRVGLWVRRLAVKTHRPAHHAILALEPKGGSRSARVTMRNTKALVTLSIPIISRGTSSVPLTFRTVTECLRPHRCQ
jgi:hypothetical protein